MKYILPLILTILIGACSSIPGMPGYLSVETSSFDNSTQVSMEPAYVFKTNNGFSGADIHLSLFWRSTMQDDEVVLIASVTNAKNIARGESLHFNIDGTVHSFESVDSLTKIKYERGSSDGTISGHNVSSKRYLVTKQFVQQILNASNVKVKLDLYNSFYEGVFTDTTTSSAYGAFKKFIEKASEYGY